MRHVWTFAFISNCNLSITFAKTLLRQAGRVRERGREREEEEETELWPKVGHSSRRNSKFVDALCIQTSIGLSGKWTADQICNFYGL